MEFFLNSGQQAKGVVAKGTMMQEDKEVFNEKCD